MPNLLTQLTKDAQARFLAELNYLNLAEIRGFCSDRGIPYKILSEYPDGEMKVTKDVDRKPIVLARVRDYLATGRVGPPTCIPAEIVRQGDPPARPGPGDHLYYRWYSKEHTGVMRSLGDLTDGRFRDGAVARVLAMEFWTRGEAQPSRSSREPGPKPKASSTAYLPRNTLISPTSSTSGREASGRAFAKPKQSRLCRRSQGSPPFQAKHPADTLPNRPKSRITCAYRET